MIDSSFIRYLSDAIDNGRNSSGARETYPLPYGRFMITDVTAAKEVEHCVMSACRRETPYLINTPVNERLHYVEGAGQLCASCYQSIYGGQNA